MKEIILFLSTVFAVILFSCDVEEVVYPDVESVEITNPISSIKINESHQFIVTCLPFDALPRKYNWSSSNPTVGTISSSGEFKALSEGKTTITVSIDVEKDGVKTTVYDETEVTVSLVIISAESVRISNPISTLNVDVTHRFVATCLPSNAAIPVFTWKSSNETVGTISSDGEFIALSEGKTTISVSIDVEKDGVKTTLSDETEVTVSLAIITAESVGISNPISTLNIDGTHRFVATCLPSNAVIPVFTWKSSNETVGTISSDGEFKALSEGKTTIVVSATIVKDGAETILSDETEVTVIPIEATGITLNIESVTLKSNESVVLSVSYIPANAKPADVVWTSSNTGVATVDDGKVTAVNSGNCTITATLKDTNISASATVNVEGEEEDGGEKLSNIYFSKSSLTIEEEESVQTTIIFNPDNAENKTVSYTSSDENIAVIDKNGKVTGIKAGNIFITAKSDDGGYETTCSVKVVNFTENIATTFSGSALYVDGYVQASGSAILNNASLKTIYVDNIDILDGTGNILYSSPVGINLTSKNKISLPIVNLSWVYKPKLIFIYRVDGVSHVSVAQL